LWDETRKQSIDAITFSQGVPRLGRIDRFGGRLVRMVAAHNHDLKAAQKLGLKTAFVARPTEYGPLQKYDFEAKGEWDVVAKDFGELATRMGLLAGRVGRAKRAHPSKQSSHPGGHGARAFTHPTPASLVVMAELCPGYLRLCLGSRER